MTIIFAGSQDGKTINIYNPDSEAKVGRWCDKSFEPDRCDICYDSDTLAHLPAEGYRIEKDPKREEWRFGICHKCYNPKMGKVVWYRSTPVPQAVTNVPGQHGVQLGTLGVPDKIIVVPAPERQGEMF